MRAPKTWLLLGVGLWGSCQQQGSEPNRPLPHFSARQTEQFLTARRYDAELGHTGKHPRSSHNVSIYEQYPLDSLEFPIITATLLNALNLQLQLLEQIRPARNYRIGDLQFDLHQLSQTAAILKSRQHTKPLDLHEVLDAYQIWGGDRRGNVLFTGYFIPVIPVRKEPDKEYRFPIYNRPRDWEGALPTRTQIENEGALDHLQLEIAYARSKVDIYYMQLQGSGYVEFPDGSRQLFSYNGTNRHSYRSIEKYLLSRKDWDVGNVSISGVKAFLERNPHLADSVLFQNPSYTFFQPRKSLPQGAGNVPLLDGISVAVDQRYIPLGSCLLAAIPIYDKKQRRVIGHEYRILLAQDVGGGIKGPGHVDLFFGVGKEARLQAGRMRQYGRLWLLLPRKSASLISMRASEGR